MSDQAKLTTSLNLTKKRKKRKDLNKLIACRPNRQTRTSSCQDFHKLNNINNDNEFDSSTNDSTTLLNSTDDGLEYFNTSGFYKKENRKKRFLCCNNKCFIACSCILNVLAVIGCSLIIICVFINKKNIDNLRLSYENDASRYTAEIKSLHSELSHTKHLITLDYNNKTISNHSFRIQMLEDEVQEFSKELIKFHYKNVSPKTNSDKISIIQLRKKFNNMKQNITNLRILINFIVKKVQNIEFNIQNMSSVIENITKKGIKTFLFKPSKEQIVSAKENSTIVFLSLSEYIYLLDQKRT